MQEYLIAKQTVQHIFGIDWKNEPLTSWDVFFDECEKVKAAVY